MGNRVLKIDDVLPVKVRRRSGELHELVKSGSVIGSIKLGSVQVICEEERTPEVSGCDLFPGITRDGQTVARIHGVFIEEAERGRGFGQLLYLGGMIAHGADWYYNSQTYPPATNVLKTLAKKGLAIVYWWEEQGEPAYNLHGGTHLVSITDAGKMVYNQQTYDYAKRKRQIDRRAKGISLSA